MALFTKWVKVEGRVVDMNRHGALVWPGYAVIFSFRAGKHRYSGAYTRFRPAAIGTPVKVEYDPENPRRVRGMIRQKIAKFLVPLILLAAIVFWVRHLTHDPNAAPAGGANQVRVPDDSTE